MVAIRLMAKHTESAQRSKNFYFFPLFVLNLLKNANANKFFNKKHINLYVKSYISGIFLLLKRPFSIGDFIKCGDISGVVKLIDLLLVKVRTFDNNMVRVQNETLIKQRVTNVTFYPMRRVDLVISVDREHNIDQVKKIIEDVIVLIV